MTLNATTPCANCVGQKAGSVRFVISDESSEEVSMKRSPIGSAMSAKIVINASMTQPAPFLHGIISLLKYEYCASISWC